MSRRQKLINQREKVRKDVQCAEECTKKKKKKKRKGRVIWREKRQV